MNLDCIKMVSFKVVVAIIITAITEIKKVIHVINLNYKHSNNLFCTNTRNKPFQYLAKK